MSDRTGKMNARPKAPYVKKINKDEEQIFIKGIAMGAMAL